MFDNGSQWTKKFKPTSVEEINHVGSYQNAKKAETINKKSFSFFY